MPICDGPCFNEEKINNKKDDEIFKKYQYLFTIYFEKDKCKARKIIK